jgi:hypothetical protein
VNLKENEKAQLDCRRHLDERTEVGGEMVKVFAI